MLTLPIKKKWFDMIRLGVKKEEYRELTPYYHSRLQRYIGQNIDVRLRNGYSKNSPTLEVTFHVLVGEGKPQWGANPDKQYYILKLVSDKILK